MFVRIENRCSTWRKSRLAARIALRYRLGILSKRDSRVAEKLKNDAAISGYLVNQAFSGLCARKGLNYHELVAP